jgi:hypothetical protein
MAQQGDLAARAVMPLPAFPARLRETNERCCRDCQIADAGTRMGWHPLFHASRTVVANERCEGLVMPLGMMEHRGLCKEGFVEPCSIEDLARHIAWAKKHDIPNDCGHTPFGPGADEDEAEDGW